ncbi:MAG: hypothetical protein J0H88_16385 [Sphingomonadales bacterium]|nr:hypothetical protein [Sphingomonadales bacterium]
MTIAIDKGIPMPRPPRSAGRARYRFGAMEVGDSFAVPLTDERYGNGRNKVQQRIMCAAAAWKRRDGRAHDFSTQIDRDAGVVRCWRIS